MLDPKFIKFVGRSISDALLDKDNYAADGQVNWCFVDADCYMDFSASKWFKRVDAETFYELWNELIEKSLEKPLTLH